MGIVEPIALGVIVILIAAGIIRGVRGLGAMRRFKSACAWVKKIDSIQIEDFIVKPRELISPDHYAERNKDEELRRNLAKGNNCLMVGVPGMGKTRAAFEALKALASKELKRFLVVKLNSRVDELLKTPLPKDFFLDRRKVVVFMDDLELFLGSPGANQIAKITDKFKNEAKNAILLATLKSVWKKDVKTHASSAYYCFKEINLDEERLTAKQAEIIAGKKIDQKFFRGTPATSVDDIKIMRQAYEKMQREIHKIMWAIKIMDFSLITITRHRLLVIYERLFDGPRDSFLPGLEKLQFSGLIHEEYEEFESDDLYLDEVIDDFPVEQEDIWRNLQTAVNIFFKEKDHEPIIRIAARSYYAGRFQLCADANQVALQLEPNDPIRLTNKGAALYELKRYQEAIECYDKALEFRKDYPDAWYNKGVALTNFGRVERKPELFHQAIQCYDKALELRKDFPEVLVNKGITLGELGQLEDKTGLFQDAIECFDKALELTDFKDPGAWHIKGVALTNFGRVERKPELFHQAIQCYDKALGLRKDFPEVLVSKGITLGELGQLEDKTGLFQDAIECFDKALELPDFKEPEAWYTEAWYNKGTVLYHLNRYEEAFECFHKALELGKNFPMPWYNKGCAFPGLQEGGKMLEALKERIKIIQEEGPKE